MYRYNVEVTRVVDGDTVDVDIDLGFGMVYKKQRVRMMGIDTPESRTRDLEEKFYGKQSKYHLEKLLSEQNVQLQSYDKGKFGRILGELFIGDNPLSVNQQMIQACHAVPYFGQSKEDTEKGHMWNREMLIQEGIIYNKNLER
jgi:micrococcal nuclease|tara:strand:+ start:69 stop:497 length:429 start_codon:yes stop_codon:yes gene_type:complete